MSIFVDIYSMEIDFFFLGKKRCYGNLNLNQKGKKARKGREGKVKTKKESF